MTISGSCLCGEVSFEIEGEFDSFYLCHCKYCQKDTGSVHAANLFSSTAKLYWKAGKGKITSFQLPATQHKKAFCSQCGSALPNLQMNNQLLVVPAGSLDQTISKVPNAHIFCGSRANWDTELESIPSFDRLP